MLAGLERIDVRVTSCLAALLQSSGSRSRGLEYDRQVKAEYLKEDFVNRWSGRLAVTRFAFECDTDEASYMTRPGQAFKIHEEIAHALQGDQCETFIDAFAGVGGDTLAAMDQFKQAHIFAIQPDVEGDQGRFMRLKQNIETFKGVVKGRINTDSVTAKHMNINTFLTDWHTTISILYLDPPWALGKDKHNYSPAAIIESFLDKNVWEPLQKSKEIHPLCIVLKLPHNVRDGVESWPKLPDSVYKQVKHFHPDSKFTMYILRRM